LLPKLDRPHLSPKVCCDLLPGFQSIVTHRRISIPGKGPLPCPVLSTIQNRDRQGGEEPRQARRKSTKIERFHTVSLEPFDRCVAHSTHAVHREPPITKENKNENNDCFPLHLRSDLYLDRLRRMRTRIPIQPPRAPG